MGAIPPLNDAQWHDAFAKYQQIPQYRLENHGMSLDAFKAHLLVGMDASPARAPARRGVLRAVRLVRVDRRDRAPRMAAHAAAVRARRAAGLRRLVDGESGLETRVSVSQYRLAIHLGVAIILLGAILWTALEYLQNYPLPL